MLSKSEFTMGKQCSKKLWLSWHLPAERSERGIAALARMKSGTEIGKLARARFPDGVLVNVSGMSNEQARDRTAELMESGCPAIFEATFLHQGCIARVDVLTRVDNGWRVTEVKATTNYDRKEHLPDVAFQVSLLKSLGISVVGASLLHLNTTYVWNGQEWDVQQLFGETDITAEVAERVETIPDEVQELLGLALKNEYPPVGGVAPYVDPIIHAGCKGCEFSKHCSARVPADHVYYLGLHHTKTKKMLDRGLRRVGEVPTDIKLTPIEQLRLDAYNTRKPAIAPGLSDQLARIQYPAHLIDFETLRPDLPIFSGHKPFQLLPFQWSCHTLDMPPRSTPLDSSEGHTEFLHRDRSDPRELFVQSLLKKLRTGESIVHYHVYEKTVINDLAAVGIPGAEELQGMANRFVDLEEILRSCYADARFLGKSSIKNVLPVLAPKLSYSDLAIKDGDQAQIEYGRMLSGELSIEESEAIFAGLLEYCKLDTWAMVEILRALTQAAEIP